jgi:hypothetical protein
MSSCYWHGGDRRAAAADHGRDRETIRGMLADWAALTDAQRDAALAKPAATGEHGLVVQVVAVEPADGTVALLRAVTLPGLPCRVACEPREAAEIAARLAAEGQLCYALVERWQLL